MSTGTGTSPVRFMAAHVVRESGYAYGSNTLPFHVLGLGLLCGDKPKEEKGDWSGAGR